MTDEMNIVAYDCNPDEEILRHSDVGEAIEWHLDNLEPHEEVPETITVYKFARVDPPKTDTVADVLIEHLDNWLYDHFGKDDIDIDNCGVPESTIQKIREAAHDLNKVYTPVRCECVGGVKVNVKDYVI